MPLSSNTPLLVVRICFHTEGCSLPFEGISTYLYNLAQLLTYFFPSLFSTSLTAVSAPSGRVCPFLNTPNIMFHKVHVGVATHSTQGPQLTVVCQQNNKVPNLPKTTEHTPVRTYLKFKNRASLGTPISRSPSEPMLIFTVSNPRPP
ncbi:hypothetical protein GDO81_002594 [Engystomops pustulosus]|uniref:Uncharacterized protein n=1 Tax=Engystomops pustulosus TaxID=76066 RepID=A0AAV7DMF5_ENGPU|nr:hypothetical protein GDO81_002594 [Engystomops pustulosus]